MLDVSAHQSFLQIFHFSHRIEFSFRRHQFITDSNGLHFSSRRLHAPQLDLQLLEFGFHVILMSAQRKVLVFETVFRSSLKDVFPRLPLPCSCHACSPRLPRTRTSAT